MQIYFKRSGGFMGRSLQVSLDTASLPQDEAETLKQLIVDACLQDLPAEPAAAAAPDIFTYELKLVGAQSEQTYFLSDLQATAEVEDLLQQLTLLARNDQLPGDPAQPTQSDPPD
jgi:Emfourin